LQQDGLRISVLQHRYSLIDKLIHKLGISVALQYAGFQGWLCGTKRKLQHNALREIKTSNSENKTIT
jgi:hypothetical protein